MEELIADGLRDAAAFAGARDRRAPPPGAIPGFEIVGELGRGGMGVVYKAVQLSTKRVVALKIILGAWFASESARKRFQREVELTARLQHAGIVRVLESGTTVTGQSYYAMDYVEGVALGAWLRAKKRDCDTVLRLFVDICDAVAHAHAHGIVHRDLKPGNIIVDAEGKPHLLDFGLCKCIDEATAQDEVSTTMSTPGQVVGTLRYLSPEQAAGDGTQVDVRTDVYSLGVVLYEALTGVLPYDEASSTTETMRRIAEDSPKRLSVVSPGVDGEVETIILKALEKEKERRYQTVAELAADVRRFLAGEPITARRPSRTYVLRKKLRKHRRAIAFVAVTVLVPLSLLLGWIILSNAAAERAERERLARGRLEVARVQYLVEFQRRVRAECLPSPETTVPRLPAGVGRDVDIAMLARRVTEQYSSLPESPLIQAQACSLMFETEGGDHSLALASTTHSAEIDSQAEPAPYKALLLEIHHSFPTWQADATVPSAEQPRLETPEACYLASFATLDPDKALACVERGLAQAPERETQILLQTRRTCLKHVLNDIDGVCAGVQELIALGEDEYFWRIFAADALAQARRFDEALADYHELRELRQDSHDSPRRIGLVYLTLGDYKRAFAAYTSGLETFAFQSPWLSYQRASVSWILGDPAAAVADMVSFRQHGGRSFCGEIRTFLMLQDLLQRDPAGTPAAQLAAWRMTAKEALDAGRMLAHGDPIREQVVCWLESTPVPDDAAKATTSLEQRCEVTYYAGEASLLHGDAAGARRWFEACVATGLWYDPTSNQFDPMAEYHLAKWRLTTIPVPTTTRSAAEDAGAP